MNGGCKRDVVLRMTEGYWVLGALKYVPNERGLGLKSKKCLNASGKRVEDGWRIGSEVEEVSKCNRKAGRGLGPKSKCLNASVKPVEIIYIFS